jgi:hypothetical protein
LPTAAERPGSEHVVKPAHWVDNQPHILWNAYFSQPSTKEEKQAS